MSGGGVLTHAPVPSHNHASTAVQMDDTDASDTTGAIPGPPSPRYELSRFSALLSQLRVSIPSPSSPPSSPSQSSSSSSPSPSLLLLSLKPLHRSLYLHVEQRKAQLSHLYKHELDGLNIERATWTYERDHFLREIDRQNAVALQQPPVPLIPEPDYRAQVLDAPEDTHLLQLARLQHELEQRRLLVARVEALRRRRAELQAGNAAKKAHLSSLLQQLTATYDRAQPLYSTFFPSAADHVYHPVPAVVSSLPAPLYCLHYLASSYLQAFVTDDSVQLAVEEMKQPQREGKQKQSIHAVDPLVVLLVLTTPSVALTLRFTHLSALHLVAVAASVTVKEDAGTAADYAHVLQELYSGDDGSALPQFHMASLSPALQTQMEKNAELPASVGSAFFWAQQLCGLTYLHPDPLHQQRASLAEVLLILLQRLRDRPALLAILRRHQLSPAQQPASSSPSTSLVYARQRAASGYELHVTVTIACDFPIHPALFNLRCQHRGGSLTDERGVSALESSLNSADAGTDVSTLDRQLARIDREWLSAARGTS